MKPTILLLFFFWGEFLVAQDSDYLKLINVTEAYRMKLRKEFIVADSVAQDSLINLARNYVFNAIVKEYCPQWYGTPWDFNGVTRTPKKGKIACGYFVTTVLLDAGFQIPRIKWSQMASETFIKKLSSDTKRFSNKGVEEVILYFKNREDGLYIVGLDTHVGFLYKKGKVLQFVHSNYYNKEVGVMTQDLDSEGPFRDSSYRFSGRILDDAMMLKWIRKESFE